MKTLTELFNKYNSDIMEDLHTSLADDGFILYDRPLETKDYKKTTLSYLENNAQHSFYISKEQNEYIKNNIRDIVISDQNNPNQQPQYKYRSVTAVLIKR
jgi:uncharacterized protein YozE (UPF0346 family)